MKEFNPAFTSLSSFRKILANPFEAYLKAKKAYSFFIRLESLNFFSATRDRGVICFKENLINLNHNVVIMTIESELLLSAQLNHTLSLW